MRLGVSPTATSTTTGVFSGLRLDFLTLEPWGCAVCFAPSLFFQFYLRVNMGPQGPTGTASQDLPAAPCWPLQPCPTRSTIRCLTGLPAAILPPPALQPPPCRPSSLPSCASPPLLRVWMNVSSLSPWLSDFHTVRFSVSPGCFLFLNCCCPSFGCARRQCVYLCFHVGWKSYFLFFKKF